MAGGPLARRRKAEVEACARSLGIETEVLDIHDGELMPTLGNRKTIARLIRDWQADIVGIDEMSDKKWSCTSAMPSQFGDRDSWQGRTLANVPAGDREREAYLLDLVKKRNAAVADKYRSRPVELYGETRGRSVRYAEAFQLSQYGRQASLDELKRMLPAPR